MWPYRRPFRRAARWDGVAPIAIENGEPRGTTPVELSEILDYTLAHRTSADPFDVAISAWLAADQGEARDQVAGFREAGATWMRVVAGYGEPLDEVRARVRRGPPG